MKLHIRSFALSSGIFLGMVFFTLTWWLIAQGDLAGQDTLIGRLYPYYRVTPLGSVIGLLYGTIDGFFSGLVFAWLYNLLVGKINDKE
jgi:hypothetical protein